MDSQRQILKKKKKKAWRKIRTQAQAVPHFLSSLQVFKCKEKQLWNYEIPDS